MTIARNRHASRTPVILAGLLLLLPLGLTGCEETRTGNARCTLKALGPPVAEETRPADFSKPGRPRPKPKPKPTRTRVAPTCTKANSPIWKSLKLYRGAIKTNGKSGRAARYYKWDYTHGDIEKFDQNGAHLGSIHPQSGKLIKGPVKGRSIKDELR
jgi:Cytotoxic